MGLIYIVFFVIFLVCGGGLIYGIGYTEDYIYEECNSPNSTLLLADTFYFQAN